MYFIHPKHNFHTLKYVANILLLKHANIFLTFYNIHVYLIGLNYKPSYNPKGVCKFIYCI